MTGRRRLTESVNLTEAATTELQQQQQISSIALNETKKKKNRIVRDSSFFFNRTARVLNETQARGLSNKSASDLNQMKF